MARCRSSIRPAFAGTVAVLLAAPLAAQAPLPMGSVSSAQTPGDGPAEFVVDASGPGFITVIARSQGSEDLRVTVTDDEYQELTGGTADMDVGGDLGAEQFVVSLPGPGSYRVLVESYESGTVAFRVGGSFLPSDLVAAPADPDGKPSAALELVPGSDHNDTLDPGAGDRIDWYRVTASGAGTLTVLTRAEEGDLRLDLFVGGEFREPVQSSDQDQQGVLGNESVTVDVAAGETVHVRVGPAIGGGEYVAYRIASGLIPGGVQEP